MSRAKSIIGQYECVHASGIGLDYFTSRIDRLILQPQERFVLIIQDRSRLAHAAKALVDKQKVTATAPETRREGSYTQQENDLALYFDDGGFEPGKLAWNGDGLQLGPNFFHKVSDSTLLPPTHRLKKDMDDIAKGLKIASTIGGMAMKAIKTVQGTESSQPTSSAKTIAQQPDPQRSQSSVPPQDGSANTVPSYAPLPPQPAPIQPSPYTQSPSSEALFCDQCGARCRPGKRFCNNCGARLP